MKTLQLSVLKRIDALLAGARARASGIFVVSQNGAFSGNAALSPGDLTSGTNTPIVLAALDLTPVNKGLFLFHALVDYTLSAADTVAFSVQAIPAVTAITGGTALGNVHYESGQGAGQPVVVTGGTPVPSLTTSDEIATAQIAHQSKTIAGLVQLTETQTRQAIQLTVVATGGSHITSMSLWISALEQLAA